jgi:hypothetical protein
VKHTLIIAIFLAAAGCAAPGVGQREIDPSKSAFQPTSLIALTEKQLLAVRAATTKSLKDPESARFGRIIAGKRADGFIMVCGYVNARNSFGGYIGEVPFDGLMQADPPTFMVAGMGGPEDKTAQVLEGCRRSGLDL